MAKTTFKTYRILFLTIILLFVALYSYEQRRASTSWYKTVEVMIYPINVDGSAAVDKYISGLKSKNFKIIDQFTAGEAKKYNLILSKPTKTTLGPEIKKRPPTPPSPGSNVASIILWSIKFRYWAWQNTPDDESNIRRARMFVLYNESIEGKSLPHSYGLNKGLLGYVNAFADKSQQGQNNIVIAHEFLHTVGASDKYGPNGEPIFPIGYADSNITNPYKQKKAEIMAGRIPISATQSVMPNSLKTCLIGKETALEINWLKL